MANGIEILLKSLGLSVVLDTIKLHVNNGNIQRSVDTLNVIVESNALERVLVFAAKLDHFQETLDRVAERLDNLERKNLDRRTIEPGSSPADIRDWGGHLLPMPNQSSTDCGAGRLGDSREHADDDYRTTSERRAGNGSEP